MGQSGPVGAVALRLIETLSSENKLDLVECT